MHKKQEKVFFIFALHNHQPVGNFPTVLDYNYEKAYRPFLEVASRFPDVKFSLHTSGILLEWLRRNRPDYLRLLRLLVERGQVEIMGGGFYEPILPVIRDEDKRGQIEKLSSWIRDHLGVVPRGMWLAERIWEPALARPIAEAGLQYVATDDYHFHGAGFDRLFHYYLTEEEGWPLNIFPISEKLRYLVPFRPPGETLEYLRSHHDPAAEKLLVLADDGEKFGAWPGTHRAVYEEGWLEKFFAMLRENSDWLQTATFSEYMSISPPQGLVYLPASSYREMMEWSGGFWRNFFIRYPESNLMHKKMMAVRRRIDALPEGKSRDMALDFLWAGQCNCAYWHGIFGGLYLNFLRAAIWENLLKAEEEAEKMIRGGASFLDLRVEDRDFDGRDELVVVSDRFSLMFSPHLGGSMWEFSWRPAAVNFLDTMTRREEEYHHGLFEDREGRNGHAADDGVRSIHDIELDAAEALKEDIVYDRYRRGGMIEHFFPDRVSLEDFRRLVHEGPEPFFAPAEMKLEKLQDEPTAPLKASVVFQRLLEAGGSSIRMSKEIAFEAGADIITLKYCLEHCGGQDYKGWFGSEFNLAMLYGRDGRKYYCILGRDLEQPCLASAGVEEGVESICLCDGQRGFSLCFHFSRPAQLWRFPIETVSRSEAGLERTYQQSLVLPRWQPRLVSGERWSVVLTMKVKETGRNGISGPCVRETEA